MNPEDITLLSKQLLGFSWVMPLEGTGLLGEYREGVSLSLPSSTGPFIPLTDEVGETKGASTLPEGTLCYTCPAEAAEGVPTNPLSHQL